MNIEIKDVKFEEIKIPEIVNCYKDIMIEKFKSNFPIELKIIYLAYSNKYQELSTLIKISIEDAKNYCNYLVKYTEKENIYNKTKQQFKEKYVNKYLERFDINALDLLHYIISSDKYISYCYDLKELIYEAIKQWRDNKVNIIWKEGEQNLKAYLDILKLSEEDLENINIIANNINYFIENDERLIPEELIHIFDNEHLMKNLYHTIPSDTIKHYIFKRFIYSGNKQNNNL